MPGVGQRAERGRPLDRVQEGVRLPDEEGIAFEWADRVLRLADVKGRTVVVPADRITYVELGSPTSSTVGFR